MKKIVLSFLFLFLFNIFCYAEDAIAPVGTEVGSNSSLVASTDINKTITLAKDTKEAETTKKSILREFGFYGGYAKGHLDRQGAYHVAQMGLRFGFDMNPLLAKIHLKPPIGEFDFVIEPFINTIIDPHSNVELGAALMFKYMLPLSKRFSIYAEFGAGPAYYSLHTQEQSTQFNFIDQAGGGFYLFLKDDLAINAGYRRRHMSNASIKHPNSGINTDSYLLGVSYFK